MPPQRLASDVTGGCSERLGSGSLGPVGPVATPSALFPIPSALFLAPSAVKQDSYFGIPIRLAS